MGLIYKIYPIVSSFAERLIILMSFSSLSVLICSFVPSAWTISISFEVSLIMIPCFVNSSGLISPSNSMIIGIKVAMLSELEQSIYKSFQNRKSDIQAMIRLICVLNPVILLLDLILQKWIQLVLVDHPINSPVLLSK